MPIAGLLHWKKIDEPALAETPFDPDEGSCTEVVLQIGRRYFIGWVRIALELKKWPSVESGFWLKTFEHSA